MASELPPTDYFDGISFNKSFYQSSTDEYLTALICIIISLDNKFIIK